MRYMNQAQVAQSALWLAQCGLLALAVATSAAAQDASTNGTVAVPRATCGAGSNPETGLQGQVPLQDRISGRSKLGYSCNLELVGQYQGEGSAIVSAKAGHCVYMPTSGANLAKKKSQGVQVIDVSNPAKPVLATNLDTRAFHVGTWETLKVNEAGTMLAGAGVGLLVGSGKLDLYDVTDCAHPKLLNKAPNSEDSLAVSGLAHEGDWSPDGKTYWTTNTIGGTLTAIDVSDPTKPRKLYFGGSTLFSNHGVSFNADGTRMYLASIMPAGIVILDVSDIQTRKAGQPRIRQVGKISWKDGAVTQRAIPVTYGGRPHLIAIDEIGAQDVLGAVRFIDVSDETKPVVTSHIRLAIQLKANAAAAKKDVAGSGIFTYAAHYCSVDRKADPTALACGYFQSGIRVFDIQDPQHPKEIAYFNPPAQLGKNALLPGSDHANSPDISLFAPKIVDPDALAGAASAKGANLSADWCSSPPEFVGDQIWVTCSDNGFMALKFTNSAYPLRK